MIDLFLRGGPLMYPLLLLSIVSLAIIIERGVVLARSGAGKTGRLLDAIESRDLDRVSVLANKENNPVALLVREILENRELPKDEIEHKVSLSGSRTIKGLSRYLHLLELIGKISPMIGLSGTILGLAQTFQKVAAVKGAADPAVLADGIWAAMITTVTGLFVGIPAIIFFHLYNNRVKSISFRMKNEAEELIVALEEESGG
jgi:biopolymer transport protein ExbB